MRVMLLLVLVLLSGCAGPWSLNPETTTRPTTAMPDSERRGWMYVGNADNVTYTLTVTVIELSNETVFENETRLSSGESIRFPGVIQKTGQYRISVLFEDGTEVEKAIRADLSRESGWGGLSIIIESDGTVSIRSVVT